MKKEWRPDYGDRRRDTDKDKGFRLKALYHSQGGRESPTGAWVCLQPRDVFRGKRPETGNRIQNTAGDGLNEHSMVIKFLYFCDTSPGFAAYIRTN